jgi:hypothetical protein
MVVSVHSALPTFSKNTLVAFSIKQKSYIPYFCSLLNECEGITMTIICVGVRFALPHLTGTEYWRDAQLVALGRSTQEELQKLTTKVVVTSEAPTPAGILEAIQRALNCIA